LADRPVDPAVTSLCAPLVDYMPGSVPGSLDLPRSRLAVAASAIWRRNYAAETMEPRWSCPHLERLPLCLRWRHPGTGGLFRRKPGSRLINRMRWGEKALPRFIDKNARWRCPMGAPLPPEWPVRSSVSPRRKPPAGGRRIGSARALR